MFRQRFFWPSSVLLLSFVVVGLFVVGCEHKTHDEKRQVMKADWQQARANTLRGLASEDYEHGEMQSARRKIQDGLSMDPTNPQLRELMARVHIHEGELDEAHVMLDSLEEDYGDTAELPYLRGVAYEQEGKFEEAMSAYAQARSIDPDHQEALIASLEALLHMGRYQEAQTLLQSRVNDSTMDVRMSEIAARIALHMGNTREAAQHFQRAADLDHQNRRYPQVLAQLYHQLGDSDQVVRVVTQFIHATPEDGTVPAIMYVYLGDAYTTQKRFNRAVEAYDSAAKENLQDVNLWNHVAKASLQADNPSKAIQSAYKALEVDSENLEASMLLGYALLQNNSAADAVKTLEKTVQIHPRESVLVVLLGRAYQATGDTTRAEKCFTYALRLEPNNNAAQQLLTALRTTNASAPAN